MGISRRGFLQTLAVAMAGGNAILDAASKLWVPAPHTIVPVTLAEMGPDVHAYMAHQNELTDLALTAAKMLAERLANHKSVFLREVAYKLSGSVNPHFLELEDQGPGLADFEGAPRLMKPAEMKGGYDYSSGQSAERRWLDDVVYRILGESPKFDIFAPLTEELRPGVKFADNMLVGVAMDPASGLSVRVTRWLQDEGRRGPRMLTGLELAGAKWDYLDTAYNARSAKRVAPPSGEFVGIGEFETDVSPHKVQG